MIGEVDEYFYHGDHISSVVLVTDKKAKVVHQFAYMPFGELLVDNSTVDLDYRFSAKETDRKSGLGYFGARYYDNTSAMWCGVDPLWEKYAGMNPYNYCAGNPVMLMDVDGREPCKGGKSGFKRFLKKEHSRIKSFHINWPSFNDNWYKNNNFVSIKPDVELTAQKPLLRYRDINSSVLSNIQYHFFNEGSSDNLSQAVDYLYNQVRADFDDRPDFSVCTDISIYIGFTSNINEEQRNIIQERLQ